MKRIGQPLLRLAVIIGFIAVPAFDASAQSYPVKPIRIVVGFAAGGATDATARTVGQKLSEQLGQPVTVENRTGASGSIATERVAKSPPDGYTLLMMGAAETILPALRARLPYDLEHDLAPVSLITIAPYILVIHPSVPARNVKELVALARSQPGKLSYGSAGVGGSAHLAAELFNLTAKVKLVHVPYKGNAEAAIATSAGEVELSFPGVTGALPLLAAGKLRPLAVTSAKRASFLPSIPTLDESGLRGYDFPTWYGVLAPASVPKEVITRLNEVIGKTVNTPEMRQVLNKQGLEVKTSTPEEFAAFIHGEIAKNARLVKLIGIKPE